MVGIGLRKSEMFEELADLLAFVLVDFATERAESEAFHCDIIYKKAGSDTRLIDFL